MQAIGPVLPSGIRSGSARGSEAIRTPAVPVRGAVETALAAVEPAALPRAGLRRWNTQLNRQFAGAQQSLAFLDDLAGQLRGLNGELGNRLAVRDPASSDALNARLQRLDRTWRDRLAASGGCLNPQLAYSATEPAEQRFTVPGLNLRTLQSGDKEMLAFAVDGVGPAPATVFVEPGIPDDELVQRFDRALAPARIRVRADEQGSLVFRTPEVVWGAVRDSLAIKGAGIRFPTGQFNRVRVDPEPEALQPQTWTVADVHGLRHTQQQVLRALEAVRHAREDVTRSLAEAGRRLDRMRPADEPVWAAGFAAQFASLLHESSYEAFASIGASSSGVHRERVQALLALR